MLQQILAIILVIGLLLGTLALLRKRGVAQFSAPFQRVSGRPKEMQVLERTALDAQHSLYLVSVRSQVFLVGVAPGGCSRIAKFDRQEPNT